MSDMMTIAMFNGVSEQAVRNYLEDKVAEHKHVRRLGFNPGSFDLSPELQIRFLGRLVEEEIQSVIPLFAQQPIAQEPIVHDPIVHDPIVHEPLAQGLQDNGVFDSVYPDPTVDNFTLFANQTTDMALPAEMPKVEQVSPQPSTFIAQTANMDFNTETPKVEQVQVPIQHAHVEAAHNDVDAEGEPADLQVPAGLKEATVPTETYEALAYLSQLPIDQLTHVMRTLQHNLRVKQEGLLTNQTGMMAHQEMDIDEPEQLDDSDDTLPEETETPKPTREYHVRKEIYDIPPPDHTSQDSRDRYLVTCRQKGFTYKEIMKAGGYTEKEPTLRGKFRALTKPAFQRVRKPKWTRRDCELLQALTLRWHGNNNTTPGSVRPLWGQIAQEMIQYGASYPFGAGTCSRKWRSLQQQP
ncbi:hypothetical protein BHE90_006915 [Fusarium euwallaceae]|uniref:Myb-like domain-containing protein n=1 Tax=Fusarium euwallaceae TaxID=1147111 RepID=A0A430LS98_9HYPO|nr:hypothetical protein BHE90_006915 [Fusarium euwallaceae]